MSSATTVVEAYCKANSSGQYLDMLMASMKVLIKLLHNAQQHPTNEAFRRIRLGNPKIQQAVVEHEGALAVLLQAGFTKMEIDGESYLLYYGDDENNHNGADILAELQARLAVMQPRNTAKCTAASDTNTSTTTTFLSDEERQRRQQVARAKRKAQRAEKAAALRHWQEDQQEREERKAREQSLKELQQSKNSKEEDEHAAAESTTTSSSSSILKRHRTTPHAQPSSLASLEDYRTMHQQRLLEKQQQEITKDSDTKETPTLSTSLDSQWKYFLQNLPRCMAVEGIQDTSVYNNVQESSSQPTCLRTLLRELDTMKDDLSKDSRCSVWVRFDETRPQFLRALVTAALPGPSPYAGGMFCFDIYVPNDYPHVPPRVQLLTTGGGSVRFGPNLYADGKVCLSLLGTWEGPKWDPGVSTITQVLLSIQGMILGVEHPYFLEPGHGGWEDRVKTGQFASTGQTLSGATVTEDLHLPDSVVAYESQITVGTMAFAMMEMMQAARSEIRLAYLDPFVKPIQAHFYHNRLAILSEVANWESIADRGMTNDNLEPYCSSVERQCAKLRIQLTALTKPGFTEPVKASSKVPTRDVTEMTNPTVAKMEEDSKPAAKVAGTTQAAAPKETSDPLDRLRALLQEAASAGNYVKAGRIQSALQKEEQAIASLKTSMIESASAGDFIRAGQLQEQMNARVASIDDLINDINNFDTPMAEVMNQKKQAPTASAAAQAMLSDEENLDDDDDEEADHFSDSYHRWGKGQTLTSATKSPPIAAASSAVPKGGVKKQSGNPRSGTICSLRVRLPNSTVLTETFDAEDTIADVYRRIDPHWHVSESSSNVLATKSQQKHVMTPDGPRVVQAPAFANPLSSRGYTLITNHPKREFSCEIHASKSLREMGLVGYVNVTVLKCAERGVVKRGDLESRLADAQGDAMDVEGLSYEALQELTERVGLSEQEWNDTTEEQLQQNSVLVSSASHLAALGEGCEEEKKRCAICLADFDSKDIQPNLRILKICTHKDNVFHEGCLRTWLSTKSSCPTCKTNVLGEETVTQPGS